MSTASTHRLTEPPPAPAGRPGGAAGSHPPLPCPTPAAADPRIPRMQGLSSAEARLRLGVHGPNLTGAPGAADVTVFRDGRRRTIAAEDLVPGDLVLIAAGDVFPADGRVIAGALVCDQSAVDDDARPVTRTAGAPSVPGGPTAQPDLVFAGARALSGTGLVLVHHTGRRTLRGIAPDQSRSLRALLLRRAKS